MCGILSHAAELGTAERRQESLDVNGEFLFNRVSSYTVFCPYKLCVVHTALEDSWQAIFLSPF